MQPLPSSVSRDAAFVANEAAQRQAAELLTGRMAAVQGGGGGRAQARHEARGKALPRARIRALLDADAPFLELSALAAWGQHDDVAPSAGIVTGLGPIHGRLCVIVANDATVKGGAYFPETIKKHLRAQAIAAQCRLPCIYLADSAGIYLPKQAETFADAEHFGRIFANQAQMSAAGVPQLAVVLGLCTAGGAYVPAMADETIIAQGQGSIFLAGPALVRAATGEEVDAETLGGAAMHTAVSGVADHLARDEPHALALCRDVVAHLGGRAGAPPPPPALPPEAPLHPADDILGLIPTDARQPMPILPIIARLVDGSRLHAFKPRYGPTLVCGFAHLFGRPVGIVANDGILFGDSAQKGAHFINLCDQRGIPLIFLQNITGFMVGSAAERAGIAKDGAKMVQAVACAQVPKLTVIVGGSHGAGNYAMCGRGYGPNFLFSWPTSRIGVMGGEQAAQVMMALRRPADAADADAQATALRARYAEESSAYYATSRLWDDGIIHPTDTRRVLGLALEAALHAPAGARAAPVFRM